MCRTQLILSGGIAGACVRDVMDTPRHCLSCVAADDGDDEQPATVLRSMPDTAVQARFGPSRHTLLHYYANEDNARLVSAILADGRIDPNARNRHTRTALHSAFEHESFQAVEALVACGRVDINASGVGGRTGLHMASITNNLSCTALMLKQARLDVNARDADGNTSFMCAIRTRLWDMASLIGRDPRTDPNVINTNGCAAIHIAASWHGGCGLETILQIPSADVNARNMRGGTALMLAMKFAPCSRNVALLLADSRIDVNAADLDGMTTLHHMCARLSFNQTDLMRLVRHPDINLNSADCIGRTAADVSVEFGNAAAFEILLSTGLVDVHRQGFDGQTLVESASCVRGDVQRRSFMRVLAPHMLDAQLVRHACAYPVFKHELSRRTAWGLSGPYADCRSRSSVVACLVLVSSRGQGVAAIRV